MPISRALQRLEREHKREGAPLSLSSAGAQRIFRRRAEVTPFANILQLRGVTVELTGSSQICKPSVRNPLSGDRLLMGTAETYRGVPFSIPRNDDGVWHYKIHPGRLSANRPRPALSAIEGYSSRDFAVDAARQAIDSWISRDVH